MAPLHMSDQVVNHTVNQALVQRGQRSKLIDRRGFKITRSAGYRVCDRGHCYLAEIWDRHRAEQQLYDKSNLQFLSGFVQRTERRT